MASTGGSNPLGQGSNPWGRTRFKNMKATIIHLVVMASLKGILKQAKWWVKTAEFANLTNEQWFINWEDELNKLSCKDHSKK